VTVM